MLSVKKIKQLCVVCPHHEHCRILRKRKVDDLFCCPRLKKEYVLVLEQIERDKCDAVMDELRKSRELDDDLIDYRSFGSDKDVKEAIKDEQLFDVFHE